MRLASSYSGAALAHALVCWIIDGVAALSARY
jgi:hypothetical protein